MSWQDYVTQQLLGKNLKNGAIAGMDGQIWAKVGVPGLESLSFVFQSPDFNVTSAEIKNLVDNYDSQQNLASSGFLLGGQKYFYLR